LRKSVGARVVGERGSWGSWRESDMNELVNPLIKKGMTAQLGTRRARIAAGEKPLGWKVGLGSPTTLQKLGLQAPLIGFLMQRALLASGSTVSLRGYGESSRCGN